MNRYIYIQMGNFTLALLGSFNLVLTHTLHTCRALDIRGQQGRGEMPALTSTVPRLRHLNTHLTQPRHHCPRR